MAPRRAFTGKEKVEIISKLKNGVNNAELCKEYKVPHSTISSIWKNRDDILKCFKSKSLTMKKNRKSTHQDVENALLVWYKHYKAQKQNVALSGPLLQEKANDFARLFGKTDFSCSGSWISRFRKRYDIVVGKGRESSVLKNDWQETESKLTEDNIDSQIWKAEDTDPEPNYDRDTPTLDDQNTFQNVVKSCHFCKRDQAVCDITDKPYVMLDKTILTINDLNIEVNFNEDASEAVCRKCDNKLNGIIEFVKLVKTAQKRLTNDQSDDTQSGNQSASSINGIEIEGDNYNETNNKQIGVEWLYRSDSESVSQTLVAYKRKSEIENHGVKKKHRVLDPLSLNNDTNNLDYNETNKMVQCKDEIDDNEYVKEVISANITLDVIGVQEAIEIKQEIIEKTIEITKDDRDQKIQPQKTQIIENIETSNNIYNKVHQHEIEFEIDPIESGGLYSVPADRINESVRKRNVANDRISSVVKDSSDTVGAMSKSDLVLLVKSIVSEMLNK